MKAPKRGPARVPIPPMADAAIGRIENSIVKTGMPVNIYKCVMNAPQKAQMLNVRSARSSAKQRKLSGHTAQVIAVLAAVYGAGSAVVAGACESAPGRCGSAPRTGAP